MKKECFLLIFCISTIFLVGGGCTIIDSVGSEQKTAETVMHYMSRTLGSIPTADLDYDKAKEYLVPELQVQFENPMFIPSSYCIQDGPDAVTAVQREASSIEATVRVRGSYGGNWQDMWDFSLVKRDDDWIIREITCLNL